MFLQISYNAMTLPSFQTAFSKSASDSAELIYQGSKPSALTNFSSPSYTGNQKKIPQQKFHGSIQRKKKIIQLSFLRFSANIVKRTSMKNVELK